MTTSTPTAVPALNEALVRDILRVICRLSTQRGQLVLYRFAVESPEKGFASSEVKTRLGFDHKQHRGLMSALSGRIIDTSRETSLQNKSGIPLMFRQEWEGINTTTGLVPSCWRPSDGFRRWRRSWSAHSRTCSRRRSSSSRSPSACRRSLWHRPGRHATRPHPESPFREFLAKLDGESLVFPADVIANLLLALQVKRFVILTGISGTGKTRIGQALATRFRSTRRAPIVPDIDDLSCTRISQPYMRKHSRIVLPVALSSHMDCKDGPGQVRARWLANETELATAHRNGSLFVFFKGAFKTWFNETFPAGKPFVVRLEDSADGKTDVLVFEPPGKVQEVPVENSEVITVRPDWTDHRGLLGHYNPLTGNYVSTPFLRLLLRAQEENHRAEAEKRSPTPFFALLDEMNLARVEHYFVDFLSALESGEALHLHDIAEIEEGESEDGAPIPRRLQVPPNLFFLGTVNVDETTHFFSPKVLDRAFAIELDQVNLDELTATTAPVGDLELSRWTGALPPPPRLDRKDWQWLSAYRGGELSDTVKTVHGLLARSHRHFGYRVAEEMARFIRLAVGQVAEADAEVAAWVALDLAILQKVLVKLNGTQAELEEPLRALLAFVLTGEDEEAKPLDLAPGRWIRARARSPRRTSPPTSRPCSHAPPPSSGACTTASSARASPRGSNRHAPHRSLRQRRAGRENPRRWLSPRRRGRLERRRPRRRDRRRPRGPPRGDHRARERIVTAPLLPGNPRRPHPRGPARRASRPLGQMDRGRLRHHARRNSPDCRGAPLRRRGRLGAAVLSRSRAARGRRRLSRLHLAPARPPRPPQTPPPWSAGNHPRQPSSPPHS